METALSWRPWLTASVFVVGMALAVGSWQSLKSTERDLLEAQFERDSDVYVTMIQRELDQVVDTARAIQAFYDGSLLVERREFNDYVETFILEVPHIRGVQWGFEVSHRERVIHEQRGSQALGHPYQILERNGDRWVRAADRPHYYPVYFIRSRLTDGWTRGYDWGQDPRMVAALERA